MSFERHRRLQHEERIQVNETWGIVIWDYREGQYSLFISRDLICADFVE